jgi:hypothetical protein
MLFNYIPMAVTAIGRPYLSAVPIVITLLARIGMAVILFDGSVAGFAWALCLATVITAPVITAQQRRYFGLHTGVMLRTMLPSAVVAFATAAVAVVLNLLLPQALPPLARLMVMALPLAAVWYWLLRATRHELVGEVHRLTLPVWTRLTSPRPNV